MDHLLESGPLGISGILPVDMLCSCNRGQALLVISAVLLGQCFAPPSILYFAQIGQSIGNCTLLLFVSVSIYCVLPQTRKTRSCGARRLVPIALVIMAITIRGIGPAGLAGKCDRAESQRKRQNGRGDRETHDTPPLRIHGDLTWSRHYPQPSPRYRARLEESIGTCTCDDATNSHQIGGLPAPT
jgi:hypothetical protein